MPNDTEQLLQKVGDEIVSGLVASYYRYGRIATGQTAQQTTSEVIGPERLIVYGPPHLVQLEKGRGKTSGTGPYQRYGGLSFKESLAQWMAIRGIDQKKKEGSNQEYGPVFWAIYTKINKEGYAGSPGVVSKPTSTEVINDILDKNLGVLANLYAQQVVNLFDF